MGVSGLVVEECRTTMLHHDTDISRLMIYAQQIEETKLRKMNSEAKRARPDEQSQPRSKKRYFNQDSSMVNNDRVSNPKPQGGNRGGSSFERSICTKCGKQHLSKFLAGMDWCFGCGKKGHKMRDCPTLSAKGREAKQASLDVPDPNDPRKNHFYVLQANKDKGTNPDKGTSKLIVPYGVNILLSIKRGCVCVAEDRSASLVRIANQVIDSAWSCSGLLGGMVLLCGIARRCADCSLFLPT
ncbi:uncharacterized protein LOC125838315 [Solanum verrucosum]|uniref:uncharacterized protein LOC125838315 n=1 Tax=Solanum verrucosum TaxID=315347 RepID=UPI0020D18599|nr:uncharacterized protein LOC125838315 [Solanum verrucosum]